MIDKSKIVAGYLGAYAKRPSDSVRAKLKKLNCRQNLFIYCSAIEMNEVITYLLMKDGRQVYDVYSAFELIEIYLGKAEDLPSLVDLRTKVLIIKVLTEDSPNQRKWDIVRQVCVTRWATMGLGTVVLTNDRDYLKVSNSFKEFGSKVISVGGSNVELKAEEEF